MKTVLFSFISIILLLNSCVVVEPPSSFYYFKIINRTSDFLILKSMTINEDSITLDSIKSGEQLEKGIHLFEHYTDYKDTLISHMFSKLTITSKEGIVKKNPYVRENWNCHLDKKGKGVIGDLILEITQSDVILQSIKKDSLAIKPKISR
jgi:hypothetical protein